MNCPNCKSTDFIQKILTDDLQAIMCTTCHGHWINSFQYWLWREKQPLNIPEKDSSTALIAEDNHAAKICPECGKLLQRYQVGHGTNFSIERCEVCRGIWFDKNEWEILKDKNLHDEVHFIFSSSWQKSVREEITEKNRLKILEKKLSTKELDKVAEFKSWLVNHPDRSMILAYLYQC